MQNALPSDPRTALARIQPHAARWLPRPRTLRRLFLALVAIGVLTWTGLVWGTYVLVTAGGEWLASSAVLLAWSPEIGAAVEWTSRVAAALGPWAFGFVWAIGLVTAAVGAAIGWWAVRAATAALDGHAPGSRPA